MSHPINKGDYVENIDFSKIIEQQGTAIIILDCKDRIVYLNSSAEFMFGRSGRQLKGEPLLMLMNIDDAMALKLASVKNHKASYSVRHYELNADNIHKPQIIDLMLSPYHYVNEQQNGKDEQVYTLLEIQLVDRLIRISREEDVLAKQETTSKLVRGVAHEIKNPLGGIRGAAQLLEMELDNHELKEYTQVIIDETERLKDLVDNLLGSSRLMDIRDNNVHEVLERVYKLVHAQSQGSIKLVRDYDPSLPDFKFDQAQLIQAVMNIAFNAVQALTESNDKMYIEAPEIIFKTRIIRQFTIGSEFHKLVCHVMVEDNGPGVPKEIIDNVFYPMISGRPTGTGLGLSISQQIVTRHQGIIQCVSEAGCTQFSIYIPLAI